MKVSSKDSLNDPYLGYRCIPNSIDVKLSPFDFDKDMFLDMPIETFKEYVLKAFNKKISFKNSPQQFQDIIASLCLGSDEILYTKRIDNLRFRINTEFMERRNYGSEFEVMGSYNCGVAEIYEKNKNRYRGRNLAKFQTPDSINPTLELADMIISSLDEIGKFGKKIEYLKQIPQHMGMVDFFRENGFYIKIIDHKIDEKSIVLKEPHYEQELIEKIRHKKKHTEQREIVTHRNLTFKGICSVEYCFNPEMSYYYYSDKENKQAYRIALSSIIDNHKRSEQLMRDIATDSGANLPQ